MGQTDTKVLSVEELLAAAATGVIDVAVVSAHLDGLDRDVLDRLAALGVAVVGIARDDADERWLRQLGVVDVHTGAGPLTEAREAATARARSGDLRGFANPFGAVTVPQARERDVQAKQGSGQVVAVWGPAGAPGRSTVALGLAGEIARAGWPTLLVDADPYGGTLALSLGLHDESSGLAAACRAANLGTLDATELNKHLVAVRPTLSLLTGIAHAQRWPELRPSAIDLVLGTARTQAAVTVVDCGFCLEQDEELSYDTLAPRRNGATLAALDAADLVVVVGSAEPAGVRRMVQGLADLAEAVPHARTSVVLNRVREGRDARAALRRFAGVERLTTLPLDHAGSELGRAFTSFAASLVGAATW